MSMHKAMLRCAALAAAVLIVSSAAGASEATYIGLFTGAWAGSGTVVNDAKTWPVSCKATGAPTANALTIRASCQVLLVVNVNLAVDVTYDPQSGRYSGTYSVGDMSAAISGARNGDTVSFAMTWTKPIDTDGDNKGRLTIVNAGAGNFRLLIDNLKAHGPDERTTDVVLAQN